MAKHINELTDAERLASLLRMRSSMNASIQKVRQRLGHPDTEVADDLDSASRRVIQHYFGGAGEWAYAAFDYINATHFDGALPQPLLLWGLPGYSRRLGACHIRAGDEELPPVITLHPSLIYPVTDNPWNVPRHLLGPAYALDVLLHECVHINQHYGAYAGQDKGNHDCASWFTELARLSPAVLGVKLSPGPSKPTRIKLAGGGSVVKRVCEAYMVVSGKQVPVTYDEETRWPHPLRRRLPDGESYYRENRVPAALAIISRRTWMYT